MPDVDELSGEPLDEEVEEEELEDSDTDTETEEPDRLALLEQEIASLKTQNTKLVRDFTAAVGRYQSAVDRLESGYGDTENLVKQINGSVGAVNKVLDEILNDESIDPQVRAKATEIRNRTQAEAELASLKAQVDELRNPRKTEPQVDADEDLSPLERTLNTMIVKAGFHPTRDFDWDEASRVFSTEGDEGVIGYFTTKIAEKVVEREAASRRQARKTTQTKTPSPASVATTPESKLGDDSLSLDERVATLRAMMANRV